MKKNMNNPIRLVLLLLGFTMVFTSCQYDEIAKANYPDELIYMPAALQGIYSINNLPTATLADPTPGNPFQFTINTAENQFNVPLAVYRSGINNDKSIVVNISVDSDTINKLIATDTVNLKNAEILPVGKYSLPSTVQIKKCSDLGTFNLLIDLDFLKANISKKYALAVTILSSDCKSNPAYKTAIILIDTKMLMPVADFSFQIDNATRGVVFKDNSKYVLSYSWNFGDSSTSIEQNPTHTYTASGTYVVTMSTIGIAGDVVKHSETINITN